MMGLKKARADQYQRWYGVYRIAIVLLIAAAIVIGIVSGDLLLSLLVFTISCTLLYIGCRIGTEVDNDQPMKQHKEKVTRNVFLTLEFTLIFTGMVLIALAFSDPIYRFAANLISMIAGLGILAYLIRYYYYTIKKESS